MMQQMMRQQAMAAEVFLGPYLASCLVCCTSNSQFDERHGEANSLVSSNFIFCKAFGEASGGQDGGEIALKAAFKLPSLPTNPLHSLKHSARTAPQPRESSLFRHFQRRAKFK